MRMVILESPYKGAVQNNIDYARRALRDSLMRGEAPLASHLLYTQHGVLNDEVEWERRQGIEAGLAWERASQATVVYVDRGISEGMLYGIDRANEAGRVVNFRSVDYGDLPYSKWGPMLHEARERAGRGEVVPMPARREEGDAFVE